MEVRQCDFCRMPYQSTGKKICGDCLLKMDEDFILIREYLWENDRAGIDEVSEATGVTRKSILYRSGQPSYAISLKWYYQNRLQN